MNFPAGQYGLIYADAAWDFETHSEAGQKKSQHAHYDCMTLDELKAMRDDVVFATAPDSVLVMWACFPSLHWAMDLMKTWGFDYVTGGSWNKITRHGKQGFGTGYILRSSSELFLIGKHGSPKAKNKRTRNALFSGDVPPSLHDILNISVNAGLREHSRKPDQMIDMLEKLFDGPYLELFCRHKRPGWEAWGNQTEKFGGA